MTEPEELLQEFEANHDEFREAVDGLSDQAAAEVWCGKWGVREITAHVAGWESTMAQVLQRLARGERPSADAIDITDTDGSNETFAEQAAGKSFGEALRELEQARGAFADAIRAMPLDRLTKGRTGRRIIETMTNHPADHTAEIVAWRKSRQC